MSDDEWDQLGKRLKRDWNDIDDPNRKLLDRRALNSAHYIPEHKYPLICASAAYRAVGREFQWTRKRWKQFNRRMQRAERRRSKKP